MKGFVETSAIIPLLGKLRFKKFMVYRPYLPTQLWFLKLHQKTFSWTHRNSKFAMKIISEQFLCFFSLWICMYHVHTSLRSIFDDLIYQDGKISCIGRECVIARVQRVHEPTKLWDITFCTRWFLRLLVLCAPAVFRPRALQDAPALADPNS